MLLSEHDDNSRYSVRQAASETPGILIAVLGLGICLTAREASVLSASTAIALEREVAIFIGLLSACMAAMAVFYYLKPSFRLNRHPLVVATIALITGASVLVSNNVFGGSSGTVVSIACETVFQVGTCLLLLTWGELLYAYGIKRMLAMFALACIASSLVALLLASIKLDVEGGMVAVLPAVSFVCLYYFHEYNTARNGFAPQGVLGRKSPSAEKTDPQHAKPVPTFTSMFLNSKQQWVFLALGLVSFFMIRFCVGKASFNWVHMLEGQGANAISQMCNALGTLLAGILLLLFLYLFWNEYGFEVYCMLLLILLALMMYFAFAMSGDMTWFSIVPLDMIQKLIIFPTLAAPFLFKNKDGQPLFMSSAAILAACSLGTSMYALLLSLLPEETCSLLVALAFLALVIAMFCMIWILANIRSKKDTLTSLNTQANPYLLSQNTGHTGQEAGTALMAENAIALSNNGFANTASNQTIVVASGTAVEPSDSLLIPQKPVCDAMTAIYELTRRERDILPLLVERYSASEVAEYLVISVATAKTHIRNIYAKLDVHSQRELISLYQQTAQQLEKTPEI